MNKRITTKEIAAACGVSIGTVSRVINGKTNVRPEIRDKVLAAIDALGWRPSAVAASMRTASTKMIGSIFSDLRNPLYASVIKGAEKVLSEQGYTLMVAGSDGIPAREVDLINMFIRRRIDGLVLSLADDRNPAVVAAVEAAGVPCVLVEREIPSSNVGSVSAEHADGIERATEYLMGLGHRRIALITGGTANALGRARVAGYEAALRGAGYEIDSDLLRSGGLDMGYAYRETRAMFQLEQPPTAIIAGGNQLLPGVMRALNSQQLAMPTDVSVISCGDTDLASLATPPITVLNWDTMLLGQEAGLMLVNQIRNARSTPQRLTIPVELVVRGSCSRPRTGSLLRAGGVA